MSGLECYLKGPCPAMKTEGGKDFCTKAEGDCENQILTEEHFKDRGGARLRYENGEKQRGLP